MDFKNTIIGFLSFFLISDGYAQGQNREQLIEELIEQLADEAGEDFDGDQVTERLLYYYQYKIDLNVTEGEELKELPFLFALQIENLLEHRNKAGPFLSIYELQAIDGFNAQDIERLLLFATISPAKAFVGIKPKEWLKVGTHDLMLRYARMMPTSEGYLRTAEGGKSRYLGNPDRYFVRYRYNLPKHMQLSINMKKDAGEQFFKGAQKNGFDSYSVSLHFPKLGKVENLVLGDFSLRFGQGLSLWTGLGFGKGSLIQNAARQGVGVRPYTSSGETLFFRGIAGTIKLNSLKVSPFVSYRKLDATLDKDAGVFSALGTSGHHRTATENANRKSVSQFVYGVDVKYQLNKLNVGANFYQTHFNNFLIPANRLYNQFNFTGDRMENASIYYDYTYRGTYAFGEIAHRLEGGWGSINGLISSIAHDFSVILLHRSYQKDYFSFYNQAFAESSDAKNENGFYSGLNWAPSRKISWTVYADYFKFPWLKFRVDAPSQGYDLFSFLKYSPNRKTEFNFRYRFRKKQENSILESPVNILADIGKHQIRTEAKYIWGGKFSFRNRLEFSFYEKEYQSKEKGILFYQDVLYKPMMSKWSGNMRFAIFNTDSYNSRIYAFENSVLYGYSLPAYSNKGVRFYVNLRHKLTRNMDVWLNYASFIYDEKGLGSGLDALDGNLKSDLRLQMRLQI